MSSPAEEASFPGPRYLAIKQDIAARIARGEWRSGDRVPSEHELTRAFGVSRMTVNRALRELTQEGLLQRVQGVGTFVASAPPRLTILDIRDIAEDIEGRGGAHTCVVHSHRRVPAPPAIGALFGLVPGAPVFHSVLVHQENGLPVQVEDRYVNPAVAPGYLDQTPAVTTPGRYLRQVLPATAVEHVIAAVTPDEMARRLLGIDPHEPCLLLERTTWSHERPVTRVRLLHPGSRYRFIGRFTPMSGSAPA